MVRLSFFILLLVFTSCAENKNGASTEIVAVAIVSAEENTKDALALMQRHLNAVTNRNPKALEETLTPEGTMQLLLPFTEIIEGNDAFMNYHKEWFALPNWTFETRIVNSDIGIDVGSIIVEVMYRETLRDDKPYFNRMLVSYVVKKIDGVWYVIKDHASSIEKSTD